MIPAQNETDLVAPFEINLIITEHKDQPCLELRRRTIDLNIIQAIVSCAFRGQTIIVSPKFTDYSKSLGSLIEKGLIYKDEGGVLRWR